MIAFVRDCIKCQMFYVNQEKNIKLREITRKYLRVSDSIWIAILGKVKRWCPPAWLSIGMADLKNRCWSCSNKNKKNRIFKKF